MKFTFHYPENVSCKLYNIVYVVIACTSCKQHIIPDIDGIILHKVNNNPGGDDMIISDRARKNQA